MATTFYPLPEAAARLGISQASLRRRVRSGGAQAERRPHAGGFAWWVACEEPTATPGESEATQGVPQGLPHQEGEAVRLLQAHVDDLRDQLKAREREVQELHVTMNRLLLALPAPTPEPPETQSAPPPEQGGRSWWQRLWG